MTGTFEHDFPFDPTYGHDRRRLLEVSHPDQPPVDFGNFWRELFASSMAVPPEPVLDGGETVARDRKWRSRKIRYQSTGGRRIGGWLVTPLEEPVRRLVVVGHGYGGRTQPEPPVLPESACLFFCARGLPSASLFEDIPPTPAFHVLSGIQNRMTYIHGGCCADLWGAAGALRELTGGKDLPLHYWGRSFGGGIGALALPWDDRFDSGYLVVPSFGNHPFRLRVPCAGSGQAVRIRWLKDPALAETLRYFDSALAACFLRKPVVYACALFDPSVPPPGQFAVWRHHAGPKKLITLSAGHFPHDDLDRETARSDGEARRFLLDAERAKYPENHPEKERGDCS